MQQLVPVVMARVKRLKVGDAVVAWGMAGTVRKMRREAGKVELLVAMDGGSHSEHWFAWKDVEPGKALSSGEAGPLQGTEAV